MVPGSNVWCYDGLGNMEEEVMFWLYIYTLGFLIVFVSWAAASYEASKDGSIEFWLLFWVSVLWLPFGVLGLGLMLKDFMKTLEPRINEYLKEKKREEAKNS